jgi:hypothetical protein
MVTERRCLISGLALLAAVSLSACGRGDAVPEPLASEIGSPAPPGSYAPRMDVDADGKLLLSWLEPRGEGHALRFARLTENGWSEPRTAAAGENWFANWADTPGVRAVGGHLFAHWLVRSGPGTYEYDIHAAWSDDNGETWGEAFTVHLDGVQSEHGFLSGAVLPDGSLGLAWVDGRHMKGDAAYHHEDQEGGHGHGNGDMSLRWARFEPGSREPQDKAELDGRICECCATATALIEGQANVIYRGLMGDQQRDTGIVRQRDGRSPDRPGSASPPRPPGRVSAHGRRAGGPSQWIAADVP